MCGCVLDLRLSLLIDATCETRDFAVTADAFFEARHGPRDDAAMSWGLKR